MRTSYRRNAYDDLITPAMAPAGGYAPCPSCRAPNERSQALVNVANRQGLEVLYLRCSCCGQEWKRIEPFTVRG